MKADKRIHLMALLPKANYGATVHIVGMPSKLRSKLHALMPSRNRYRMLPTGQLEQEVLCWVDHAAEMKPIGVGEGDVSDWIIATKPLDLRRLCTVIVNWVRCTCDERVRSTPAYREIMGMLQPSVFEPLVYSRDATLFDESRTPIDDFAFRGFSALVADLLVGQTLTMPNGAELTFSLATGGERKGVELVSNVLHYKGDPWSVVLRLHVETYPPLRESRLNVSATVRRYIRSKRSNAKPFMEKDVRAQVLSKSGVLRTVPYGYNKLLRGLAWDELARRNYEALDDVRLPEIAAYLEDMERYAAEDAVPRILSPCSTAVDWDVKNKVGSGLSVADKERLFEFVARALSVVTERTKPLAQVNSAALKMAHEDASSKLWESNPAEAARMHSEWSLSNRKRIAACLGQGQMTVEIIGTEADADVIKLVRRKVEEFLGGEGKSEGLDLILRETNAGNFLNHLAENDRSGKTRARRIGREFAAVDEPTGCIVLLPGRDSFGDRDPKQAIRNGLAQSGRLSQFLVPINEDGKLERRAQAAVRDLMRQLGFVFELRQTRGGVNVRMPVWGVTVLESHRGKSAWRFPLAVKLVPSMGSVEVDCPLFRGRLSYRDAQLELARITSSIDGRKRLASMSGRDLKHLLDRIKGEAAHEKTLMLVHAYGCIRRAEWWPGISDKRLTKGVLRYGPTREGGLEVEDELFECKSAGLSILRVRNASNEEVPDYYTDKKPLGADGRDSGHFNRQGLFLAGECVYGLTGRPNMSNYTDAFKDSKLDTPNKVFSEKTLNEYCLLTPGENKELIALAKYAEALRGCMVQLVNTSTKVNLPAPLHLATCLTEYLWC